MNRSLYLYGSLLIYCLLYIHCSNCNLSGTSSGWETKTVAGIIVDSTGQPVPNAQVTLIPSHYNPVTDSLLPDSLTCYTDEKGHYKFSLSFPGIYSLYAQKTKLLQLLHFKRIVDKKSNYFGTDTLKTPGTVVAFLPDSMASENNYLFIEGTFISKSTIDGVNLENLYTKLVFDSLPATIMPGLTYLATTTSTATILTDSFTVIAADTITIKDTVISPNPAPWSAYTTSNSDIPSNFISTITSDVSGKLWLGTNNGFIVSFDFEKWEIKQAGSDLAPENRINSLQFDSEMSLWVGTNSNGILHYSQDQWMPLDITNSNLKSNQVLSLITFLYDNIENIILLGTSQGLQFFTEGEISEIFLPIQNSKILCSMISPVDTTLYIGTPKGLIIKAYFYRHDALPVHQPPPETIISKNNSNLPSDTINSLCFDKSGFCWIATSNGIAYMQYVPDNLTVIGNSLLPDHDILCCTVDRAGNRWFGTRNGYVLKIDNSMKVSSYYVAKYLNAPPNASVGCISTLHINENQSSIYLGTQNYGLVKCKDILKNTPELSLVK